MKRAHVFENLIKRNKGVISVYLCLILAVIIPLLMVMFEAARYSAMNLTVECATDMAMDSCLAEYHRELLDRYGLLFVDTAYETSAGSLDNVSEHIAYYMTSNLRPQTLFFLSKGKDLYGLKLDDVEITRVSRATDNGGEVFRYMANSYMLEYYGFAYVDRYMDTFEATASSGLLDIDIEENLDKAEDAFSNISVSEEDMETYNLEEPPDFTNPAEGLEEFRRQGILKNVCDDVSCKSITPGLYVSGRSLVKGDGMYEKWEDRDRVLEAVLFNEYIMLMCGNYLEPKDDTLLDYEVEYILIGKSNDTDNLKDVVTRIFLMRGGANTLYFTSDDELKTEAKQMSELLTFFYPPAAPVVEALIDVAWIYSESMYDVKQIMQGGKVSIFTTKEEWDLSLTNALFNLVFFSSRNVNIRTDKGWDYNDYLRFMLYLEGIDKKTYRCMDIVEMNIRKATGDDTFCLDNCVAAFEMQSVVFSNLGYEFLVKKDFGYW